MDRIKLPDAVWRHRAGIVALCETLGAAQGDCRFVGGAVRDTLLGTPSSDIDIATKHQPGEVIKRLNLAGIKTVPTGIAHGTISAILPDGLIEITTLRRDVSTNGRHADVAFTDDWREDALRRDFTINALYADPVTGELFDYCDGLRDLAVRRVRFIGDPFARIAEDHLRLLRFFRFLARFGDTPDPAGLAACIARANDLMALSRERIADELFKLLTAANAPKIVALMVENGILAPVIPEIAQAGVDRLARVAAGECHANLSPDAIRRLAALLNNDTATGETIGARLKLSNAQRKRLVCALSAIDEDEPRALAYRLGVTGAIDRLLLHLPFDEAQYGIARLKNWEPPRFPLSGGNLVKMGIVKGPEVARLLRLIENQWVSEGFAIPARLAEITKTQVDHALLSYKNA